jgi:hypothetical protein
VERVDWDSLQIVETYDDEDPIALVSEKQICEILGLREEETHVDEGQMNEQGVDNEQCVDNLCISQTSNCGDAAVAVPKDVNARNASP